MIKKRVYAITAVLALLCLCVATQAVVTETVRVGDPGNAGEVSGSGSDVTSPYPGPTRMCGSVGYSYNISKYEVTAAQYTDFLNHKAATDDHGLYNAAMWSDSRGCKIQRSGISGSYTYSVASDQANKPVNYVSYWDSCRFANWLGNGQGSGDTETGAYTLNGYNGDDGRTIQRNAGWQWAVTSEDEWYKAAYYKGGGANVGYWDYPTRGDTISSGMANYGSSVGASTAVGSYSFSSAYGTFDQGGNVWEWNEAIIYEGTGYAARGSRGGSYKYADAFLRAGFRYSMCYPSLEDPDLGFRVVQAVPEPSSVIALAAGLLGLLGIRRRKA